MTAIPAGAEQDGIAARVTRGPIPDMSPPCLAERTSIRCATTSLMGHEQK